MITLAHLQHVAWEIAERKGLHDNLRHFPHREATLIRLALIHTEVSEAAQEVKRHGVTVENTRVIGEELADVLIRVADLAEELGIDLSLEVDIKLSHNRLRPYKYGTPDEEKPQS
jgi:NTP pyrophosphatase (non-canonical NTP hydrolase)